MLGPSSDISNSLASISSTAAINFPKCCRFCDIGFDFSKNTYAVLMTCRCNVGVCEGCWTTRSIKLGSEYYLPCPVCGRPSFVTDRSKELSKTKRDRAYVKNLFVCRGINEPTNTQCLSCLEVFPQFTTVKLSCSCTSVVCQLCVRLMVQNLDETFYSGMRCPLCRSANIPIQCVRECAMRENELIRQAITESNAWQDGMMTDPSSGERFKEALIHSFLELLRTSDNWAYPNDCKETIEDSEIFNNIYHLRLAVATMQERRILQRKTSVGFLKLLYFPRHDSFERFLCLNHFMSEAEYNILQYQDNNLESDDDLDVSDPLVQKFDSEYVENSPKVDISDVSLNELSCLFFVAGVGYLCPLCPNENVLLRNSQENMKKHIRGFHAKGSNTFLPSLTVKMLALVECNICKYFVSLQRSDCCTNCGYTLGRQIGIKTADSSEVYPKLPQKRLITSEIGEEDQFKDGSMRYNHMEEKAIDNIIKADDSNKCQNLSKSPTLLHITHRNKQRPDVKDIDFSKWLDSKAILEDLDITHLMGENEYARDQGGPLKLNIKLVISSTITKVVPIVIPRYKNRLDTIKKLLQRDFRIDIPKIQYFAKLNQMVRRLQETRTFAYYNVKNGTSVSLYSDTVDPPALFTSKSASRNAREQFMKSFRTESVNFRKLSGVKFDFYRYKSTSAKLNYNDDDDDDDDDEVNDDEEDVEGKEEEKGKEKEKKEEKEDDEGKEK